MKYVPICTHKNIKQYAFTLIVVNLAVQIREGNTSYFYLLSYKFDDSFISLFLHSFTLVGFKVPIKLRTSPAICVSNHHARGKKTSVTLKSEQDVICHQGKMIASYYLKLPLTAKGT